VGEAVDGVEDAVDRANRAPTRVRDRDNRVSRTSQASRPIPASTLRGVQLRDRDRTAVMADQPVRIARSSADRALGR
jgi:hypothetical protein